ncbi:MAG: F0F1 ATP synthase subunit B [Gemmatimonadota bacterium]|jgi:F-type H+-transporting ATPase subunit b
MNFLWILQEQAGEAAKQPNLFSIDLGVSFWTVLIFVVLLVVLYRYAYPHILGAVEAREQRIDEAIRAAEESRAEAEKLLEEQRRELAEARHEAQQLMVEGRQAADRIREDMLSQARTEQEQILTRAREEIEHERVRAVETLRHEAVELSIAAASKLVERNLDTEQDHRLVREYLERATMGGPEA